jgi:serine protease Do
VARTAYQGLYRWLLGISIDSPVQRTAARAFVSPIIAAVVLILGVASNVAHAELKIDKRYGEVSGWAIGFSETLRGCVAATKYRDETTVWLGFTMEDGDAYIAFTNPNWKSIREKGEYDLELSMDGGNWKGKFTGFEANNEKGIYSFGLKREFVIGVARSRGVRVLVSRQPLASLSLSGSTNALSYTLNCQKEYTEASARNKGSGGSDKSQKGESSGTGFFVSSEGHLLTNHHVIDGCSNSRIARPGMPDVAARIVARDKTNDLALLKVGVSDPVVPAHRAPIKLGEPVFVFGFPLSGILTTTGNFTTGIVTGTAGLSDDTRLLQISAPVQPGNSGGPLIDKYGNVVGVIVSKLNAMNVAAATNDIPQNVNFAIKTSVADNFLETNGVAINKSTSNSELPSEDVADLAKKFTVQVICN